MTAKTYRLVAYNGEGDQTVVGEGPLSVTVDRSGAESDLEYVRAAAEQLGADVALLGGDAPDVLDVEVLGGTLRDGLWWAPASRPFDGAGRARWAQPGWYADASGRIDAALHAAGRTRIGSPVQFKHWSISAILRVPTDAGLAWYKEVPRLFAYEGRLVAWLADLAPDIVARPLAVGDGWWLAEDLPAAVPVDDELSAVARLVDIQAAAMGRDDELLALGCADRRLETLVPELVEIAGSDDVLSAEQRDRLSALLPVVAASVAQLQGHGMPPSVVHGDFHPGNVRHTASGWRIYDWTDGCLAHPLVDVSPGIRVQRETDRPQRWLAETAAAWRSHGYDLSRELLDAAVVAGTAHQVASYARIARSVATSAVGMWSSEADRWVDVLLEQFPEC